MSRGVVDGFHVLRFNFLLFVPVRENIIFVNATARLDHAHGNIKEED
jgi:hypothetical protein